MENTNNFEYFGVLDDFYPPSLVIFNPITRQQIPFYPQKLGDVKIVKKTFDFSRAFTGLYEIDTYPSLKIWIEHEPYHHPSIFIKYQTKWIPALVLLSYNNGKFLYVNEEIKESSIPEFKKIWRIVSSILDKSNFYSFIKNNYINLD